MIAVRLCSHFFSFSIELPGYTSYEQLRSKLLFAIVNCVAIDIGQWKNTPHGLEQANVCRTAADAFVHLCFLLQTSFRTRRTSRTGRRTKLVPPPLHRGVHTRSHIHLALSRVLASSLHSHSPRSILRIPRSLCEPPILYFPLSFCRSHSARTVGSVVRNAHPVTISIHAHPFENSTKPAISSCSTPPLFRSPCSRSPAPRYVSFICRSCSVTVQHR
jgi:hypothetical protein